MSYNDVVESVNSVANNLGLDAPILIAVSKVQPLERVETVLKAGHRVFGENRVQEALSKWPDFKEHYENVDLHLLGPLQSNKVKQAFSLFSTIHSLDRISLAEKIAKERDRMDFCPSLFIQVNIGKEPQKSGVLPEQFDEFLTSIRALELPITGLMCIPPFDAAPRPFFRELKTMADANGFNALSMGMSSDYEAAIEEGATHIRVGSAIFGERSA